MGNRATRAANLHRGLNVPDIAASRVDPSIAWTLLTSPEPFAALVVREDDGSLAGVINTSVVGPSQGAAVGAWAAAQIASGHKRTIMHAHELPAAAATSVKAAG